MRKKYVKEPDLDWDNIRRARRRCRTECKYYNLVTEECKYYLIASFLCPRFKKNKRMRRIDL